MNRGTPGWIAIWIAFWGVAFIVVPFAASAWPNAVDLIVEWGRGLYAIAFATCVIGRVLELCRHQR